MNKDIEVKFKYSTKVVDETVAVDFIIAVESENGSWRQILIFSGVRKSAAFQERGDSTTSPWKTVYFSLVIGGSKIDMYYIIVF